MSVSSPRFSLYKRSNLVYYIGYYQNGRRRWKSTGATTRSEALKALSDFKALVEPARRAISYPEFQTEFMTYAEVQPITVARLRQSLVLLAPRGIMVDHCRRPV